MSDEPLATGDAPRLIDTHTHLDDAAFDGDREAVLAASIAAGVTAWVNVGYAPEHWRSTIRLARSTRGMAHMLGMHPQHAAEWSPENAEELERLLVTTGVRAIGEIGLDYAPHAGDHDQQKVAFSAQLRLAARLRLPVVIHMRASEADLVAELREFDPGHPVLLHSFDGTRQLFALALEREYLLGVGGLATRQKSGGVRDLLREAPPERIVLETDSPYLVPARQRDRRNQPANVAIIARFLADLTGQSVEQVATMTTRNAERFFGSLVPAGESVS